MKFLPDDIRFSIFLFVNPFWLRLTNRYYWQHSLQQCQTRQLMLQLYRKKKTFESCRQMLKKHKQHIQNYKKKTFFFTNFRDKDKYDDVLLSLESEMYCLQKDVSYAHTAVQKCTRHVLLKTDYSFYRIESCWKKMLAKNEALDNKQ